MSNETTPEVLSSISSENLSSIIFFTQSDYATGATQASYLAARDYGATVEGLGTLSKTTDGDTYWSNYKGIVFKETNYTFNSMSAIYNEALAYANEFDSSFSGNAAIENGRYTARYTYQGDLQNKFSNAEPVTFTDIKAFLVALNKQTFNKQKMYNGENEVSWVKLGLRTFDWHNADDISYIITIEDEYTVSYSYSYEYTIMGDDGELQWRSYEFSYDTIVPAETMPSFFGEDNYYTYMRKRQVPIDEYLHSYIAADLKAFEDAHSNYEDNYTYYMDECKVVIPMTLSTRSMGTKKSTFLAYFDSDYAGWFYDTINFNAELEDNGMFSAVAKVTSGADAAIFSARKNHDQPMASADIMIDNGESKYIVVSEPATLDDMVSLTTPYKMAELSLAPVAGKMSGILDMTSTGWTAKGNMMKTLVAGSDEEHSAVTRIFGLNKLQNLRYLSLRNMNTLQNTPAISTLGSLNVLDARGSNITAFKPKSGATIYEAWLPQTIKSIKLDGITLQEGQLEVMGEQRDFFGRLNYIPNSTLESFSCTNTTGVDTFTFVSSWIDALKEADKLKLSELIYLELDKINWTDTPYEMVENLKKFDIDVNESTNRRGLAGSITIHGTGNYGLLTVEEYSKVLRMYGRHAFTMNGNEKVFPSLVMYMWGNIIEPYDFYLKVRNETVNDITNTQNLLIPQEAKDERNVELEYSGLDSYNPPIAAMSFLEVIRENNGSLVFTTNTYERYAFCKLDRSIDTTNAVEISSSNINAGDLMLFNGDTIMLFFGTPVNDYRYVKLGSIKGIGSKMSSTGSTIAETWFTRESVELKFSFNEKPEVISGIGLENLSGRSFIIPDSDEIEDRSLNVEVNITPNRYDKLAISTGYEEPPLDVTLDSDTGVMAISNAARNLDRDIVVPVTLKSTMVDNVFNTLFQNASEITSNLVNTTIDVIVANAATLVEGEGIATVVLSDKLYAAENDTLVVVDPAAVSITEDDEYVTIHLK